MDPNSIRIPESPDIRLCRYICVGRLIPILKPCAFRATELIATDRSAIITKALYHKVERKKK